MGNDWKAMPTLWTSDAIYFLGGRDLLSNLQWKKGQTILQICQLYVNYVNGNFRENAEVVFDGYPDKPNTKDTTHLKHIKGKTGRLRKFNVNV